MSGQSMLEGGEVTSEETIAIQLWFTYLHARGDFEVSAWLQGANITYLAAQKWLYLDRAEKDAWLAVAAKAPSIVAAPVGG